MITTFIILGILVLCVMAIGASVHEQNIKRARSRRKDLLTKQTKVMRAIDEMLANQERLPISNLMYSLLHRRMILSIEFCLELAVEMRLRPNFTMTLKQKAQRHEAAFQLHHHKAQYEEYPVLPLDPCVSDVDIQRCMHAAYRLARVLRRGGAAGVSDYEQIRNEIERIENVAAFYNCLKSKYAADVLFEKEHHADARPLYQKIINHIATSVPEAHRRIFETLHEACLRKLDAISLFDLKMSEMIPQQDTVETDGLERFFSAQKHSFH